MDVGRADVHAQHSVRRAVERELTGGAPSGGGGIGHRPDEPGAQKGVDAGCHGGAREAGEGRELGARAGLAVAQQLEDLRLRGAAEGLLSARVEHG
ncbi:hypothetical protein GCM10025876_28530 [Demequina litorisediminis]|uniref:Uncharacterized protein n=1 Tax=Demequina litorisediminis TaxID=1849022 RepID=A0ABQ6IFX5_9MICO|nr:hypothetical protein GCM10025876_28530 [Demequina litorisediminis]